jgi:hypothetical protein
VCVGKINEAFHYRNIPCPNRGLAIFLVLFTL